MGHRERIVVLATDTSVAAVQCNAMVDDCKKSVLRMSPWNFATKRSVITPPASITLATPFVEFVSSGVLKFTVASHTFVATDYVTSANSGVPEATGPFEVSSVTATTITVAAPGVTAITGTPAAGTIRISPAFDYSYLYTMPTACLRVITINDKHSCESWRVEGRKILSHEGTKLQLRYIYDVTDYTTMDANFYQVLAHYLAYNLCDVLSASDAKKNELHAYLYGGQGKRGILPQGRFVDASEDSVQELEANDWILSRGSRTSDPLNLGN
jgi:hypothetical protein